MRASILSITFLGCVRIKSRVTPFLDHASRVTIHESPATHAAMQGKEKHALRAHAHHLKPVVTLGAAGLTDAVVTETGLALEHHELIKVKIGSADRKERSDAVAKLCARTGAELVQLIGQVAILYRENKD